MVFLAASAVNTKGPRRRRAGVSSIGFVLVRSFIITCFMVFCLCASDWSEGLSPLALSDVTQAIRCSHGSKRVRFALRAFEEHGGKEFREESRTEVPFIRVTSTCRFGAWLGVS